jgi:uncharacterized protein YndB with AHSA1/START domain
VRWLKVDGGSNGRAGKDFVISRVFDAPRDLLWQCTDLERMKHWWGPKGFTVIASKMGLRVGGTYHYGMTAPNDSAMWGLFTYREIVPQQKLVFSNSFSDEKGSVTRHPGHQNRPLKILSTFTFEDAPVGKTMLTVRWADARFHAGRTEDLRHHARQHDAGLDRHHAAARSLSGQSKVRNIPMQHQTASRDEWLVARKQLLGEATDPPARRGERSAAAASLGEDRQALCLQCAAGKTRAGAELFDGCSQLIVRDFMFGGGRLHRVLVRRRSCGRAHAASHPPRRNLRRSVARAAREAHGLQETHRLEVSLGVVIRFRFQFRLSTCRLRSSNVKEARCSITTK